jgi:hypothetical protein
MDGWWRAGNWPLDAERFFASLGLLLIRGITKGSLKGGLLDIVGHRSFWADQGF